MTAARYARRCGSCGDVIEVGEEIREGAAGWVHLRCVVPTRPAPGARWYSECGHTGHTREQQELITERGMLKVRTALDGNTEILERLAALTPSCLQTDAEWSRDTFGALADSVDSMGVKVGK